MAGRSNAHNVVSDRTCLFNTRTPHVSKETSELLKAMMKESKLTNFQQRQLQEKITRGESLPLDCNPTSSQSKQRLPIGKKKSSDNSSARESRSLSGLRSKQVIDALQAALPPDVFRPVSGKAILEEDKEKLRRKMAYGDANFSEISNQQAGSRVENANDSDSPVDPFDEIVQQIEERKQFLDEMEQLGQGSKYRHLLNTEISQRIRDLELIDRSRRHELEMAMKAQPQ